MKYWIRVISKDHVQDSAAGGFTQVGQDKATDLQMLHKDDLIFFYSPGTLFRAGEILQAFTAVARIADDTPYQVEMSARVRPWRRQATFLPCEETPIGPLVPRLDFIEDEENWAGSLRRGMFEIDTHDARLLADAMKADIDTESPAQPL